MGSSKKDCLYDEVNDMHFCDVNPEMFLCDGNPGKSCTRLILINSGVTQILTSFRVT